MLYLHCCCSVTKSCPTLYNPMNCSMPGFPFLHHLPEFAQIHVHWVGEVIQPSHPLMPPFSGVLSSIFLSIRVFSNESALHIMWPKYWNFSFSISLSNKYLELISLWIGWFDLLAVQETLKSFLQHHNLKTSILRHSAFLMFQLSYLHMTIGKTIALTIIPLLTKWYLCFLIC